MLDRERADHRFATLLRWVTGTRPERLIVLCFDAPADAAGAGATALRLAGCLADLPAHRLVDLALASGGSVVAAHDACPAAAALPHLEPLPALTGVRVTVRAQTPEPGQPAVVVDEAQPPVGRRFLVRRPTEPPVIEHAADSDDQARLVASLRALGVLGVPDGTTDAGAAPGVALDVTGCMACGVCVRACPHDALALTHTADVSTLTQRPDRCHAEGACAAACPEHAIRLGEPHAWATALAAEPVAVARLRTRACGRCGTRITVDRPGGLCALCARRRTEPFGWDVPDAVRDRLPEHLRRRLDERGRA